MDARRNFVHGEQALKKAPSYGEKKTYGEKRSLT